jgi:site-specific recombinase XerD
MREDGRDIRTVQDLLGHRDVTTPQMYTHVLNRGPYRLRRPGPARRAGISSVPGQT